MTKKQIDALWRILDREAADYQVRSGRPIPGQHYTGDKVAISDGNILVLLNSILPGFPVGERADTFARIMRNERELGSHLPVSANQIRISAWKDQAQSWNGQADVPGVELTVLGSQTQMSSDSLVPRQAIPDNAPVSVVAQFNPQLLVDAAEVVSDKPQMFLGMGRFNSHFPSLLVFPPNWVDRGDAEPIVLVLPLRR